jgi:hypothetical protein
MWQAHNTNILQKQYYNHWFDQLLPTVFYMSAIRPCICKKWMLHKFRIMYPSQNPESFIEIYELNLNNGVDLYMKENKFLPITVYSRI